MYKYELNLIEKYKDGRSEGINEGISIGRAEGEANERSRMVKSFKEQGVPIDVIAKAANLSIEEINRIQ